jgi:hypothetical protein
MSRREPITDPPEPKRKTDMKTKLLTLATVAALTLGAGVANALTPAVPGAEIGPQVSADSSVEPASFYFRYRDFWAGSCHYKTLYVTNGYRWAYRYRYQCFRGNSTFRSNPILSRKSG